MRRLIALSFVLALFAVSAMPVQGQPAAPHVSKSPSSSAIPKLPAVVTTYDIYVGGLHFLTADILFQEEGGHYKTHLHAHTAGYLYKVLKWDGDVSSTGLIKGNQLVPVSYRNLDVWRDKPKTTSLVFDRKGDIKADFDPPNTDKNREIVTDEQKHGALDPVTALLQMLAHVAVQGDCNLTVPVFDGKRRFDLNGADNGLETVDDKDYGVYAGTARACSVDFSMIAGEWKDREKNRFWERENGDKGRDAFHIWLASVAPDLPELPVRLESTSSWGPIMAHLTNWHYAKPEELKP
jgi:hypothetical protein